MRCGVFVGVVTFVQRFGSALQINVHFHVLVPDGAFDGDGVFVAAGKALSADPADEAGASLGAGGPDLGAVDVMVCSRCDGPRKVIAVLEEPTVVKGILTHPGLPAEPLPPVNAQAPPTTVETFEDP